MDNMLFARCKECGRIVAKVKIKAVSTGEVGENFVFDYLCPECFRKLRRKWQPIVTKLIKISKSTVYEPKPLSGFAHKVLGFVYFLRNNEQVIIFKFLFALKG